MRGTASTGTLSGATGAAGTVLLIDGGTFVVSTPLPSMVLRGVPAADPRRHESPGSGTERRPAVHKRVEGLRDGRGACAGPGCRAGCWWS
ncbi:hypothetical protein ACN20G_16745 [Streptomyces sp. BI20]|uniref:hypothetical protein n=1 Tax=Streptomyces sp. BI20 TaxID=3403460 RepID=UPI003C70F8AE